MASMHEKNQGSPRGSAHEPAEFAKNMAAVAEKCQQIMQEFLTRQALDVPNTPVDPLNVGGAFMELFARLMSDPVKLLEKQFELWQDYVHLWQSAAQRLLGEEKA